MNPKRMHKPTFAVLCLALLLIALSLAYKPTQPVQAENVMPLESPAFLNASPAEAELASIADEAGIACYFKASTSINLNDVRDIFRTIETQTADYIIGSVAIPDYPESEDVHVYIHRDGWIMAYYLAADPAAKIFDWRAYNNSGHTSLTTKLENILILVSVEAGVVYTGGTYCDFRYPNANHLMLLAEWVYKGTDFCEIKLPGSFIYYERSWSLGTSYCAEYNLDGVRISRECNTGWSTTQGTLTAIQLLPDQFHTIEVKDGTRYGYAGLALVYREP